MNLPEVYLILFFLLAIGQISLSFYLWKKEGSFWQKNWKLWRRAKEKAEETVWQAENIYEDQMAATGVKMEKELSKMVLSAHQEFGKFLSQRADQTDKLVDDAMASFTKRLEDKLTAIEDRVLKFAQEEEVRVRLETEKYREEMLDLTHQDAMAVLSQVEKIILGKKITPEIQEELISQALDQAKKDAFID